MKPDLEGIVQSSCTHAAMRRAARQLGQLYDHEMAPSGLKATQLGLLVLVKQLEGPKIRVLADNLVMDISALGHTLKPLVRDGIVVLTPDASDRRAKRVNLTPMGEQKYEQALALWQRAHSRFEGVEGPGQAAQLRQTLDWIASPGFAEAFTSNAGERKSRIA